MMPSFHVSVGFVPRWQHVELLRIAVLNCLTAMLQPRELCEQLAMVTAELVENAVHYGLHAAGDDDFRLDVRSGPGDVTIEVRHPGASTPQLESLERVLRRLSDSDPCTAYRERLLEIAANPDVAGSGLGLLRVAYETGCELAASRSEEGLLCVRAVVPTANSTRNGAGHAP